MSSSVISRTCHFKTCYYSPGVFMVNQYRGCFTFYFTLQPKKNCDCHHGNSWTSFHNEGLFRIYKVVRHRHNQIQVQIHLANAQAMSYFEKRIPLSALCLFTLSLYPVIFHSYALQCYQKLMILFRHLFMSLFSLFSSTHH